MTNAITDSRRRDDLKPATKTAEKPRKPAKRWTLRMAVGYRVGNFYSRARALRALRLAKHYGVDAWLECAMR